MCVWVRRSQVMENGPLGQRALHRAEGRFHARQQDVGAPDLVGRQVLAIRLQHVAAVEFLGDRFLLAVLLPRQRLLLRIVVQAE